MKKLSASKAVFMILGCAFLLSCISNPPKLEYTLARAALASARESEAAKYAPGYWHKASTAYKKAERLYRMKDRDEAKRYFKSAQKLAETAENLSRLKRAKGEGM